MKRQLAIALLGVLFAQQGCGSGSGIENHFEVTGLQVSNNEIRVGESSAFRLSFGTYAMAGVCYNEDLLIELSPEVTFLEGSVSDEDRYLVSQTDCPDGRTLVVINVLSYDSSCAYGTPQFGGSSNEQELTFEVIGRTPGEARVSAHGEELIINPLCDTDYSYEKQGSLSVRQ